MTVLRFTVTEEDTAIALGSGDVPVLATPRLLAWMERTSVVATEGILDRGSTSVGIEVWVRHQRASRVGSVVEVEVVETVEQDRGLAIELVAREVPAGSGSDRVTSPDGPEPIGRQVAHGRVVRAIVDRDAFLART